jgi:outer membrane protein OmpA-like peptidoglycan-associated protein
MSRPSMRTSGVVAAAALLAFLAVPSAVAEDKAANDEIGVQLGAGQVNSEMRGPEGSGVGPVLDVRWGHELTDAIGIAADLLWGAAYTGDSGYGNWAEMSVGGNMDWFFGRKARTRWFLSPGVGWTKFSPDAGSTVSRGFVSLAFGQKIWPGDPDANLRWSIRVDQTVGTNGLDGAGVLTYKAMVGASFGFGGPPPDDDADGVPNRKDKCPNTPAGATVDAKGCPSDSDGDGVFDGIDGCPGTTAGWPVDAKGCPKDSDGDAVPDGKDKCPDTPKGATVDADGCPKDSDGDGVFDGIDRCAATPKGAKVGADGCPLDADGDGVFDGIDRCPDTPKGTKVDAAGCPAVVKAAPLFTLEKKSLVLEGVNFDHDSATLTPGSLAILDGVAASLRDWPEVRVEIGGHTDSSGPDAYNQKLSEQRAASVRDYLASKGIDASRMTTKGYGESKPITDNATDKGRATNRRVELTRLD